MSNFLTPKQAAEILDIHPETLRRWEQDGKINSTKTNGGHRRYLETDVLELKAAEPKEVQTVEQIHKGFVKDEIIIFLMITALLIVLISVYLFADSIGQLAPTAIMLLAIVFIGALVKTFFYRMHVMQANPAAKSSRFLYSLMGLQILIGITIFPMFAVTMNKSSEQGKQAITRMDQAFEANARNAVTNAKCEKSRVLIAKNNQKLDAKRQKGKKQIARLDTRLAVDHIEYYNKEISKYAATTNGMC